MQEYDFRKEDETRNQKKYWCTYFLNRINEFVVTDNMSLDSQFAHELAHQCVFD